MIYALILTILCGLFFFLSYFLSPKSNALLQKNPKMREPIVKNTNPVPESKFAVLKPSAFRSKFQNALHSPFQKESVFLLLSLCAWMLLPLFWGLAFFLKTDANVLIVIGCMIWTYYWLKYLFSTDEAV
ncbi:LIC10362 family protein [Leptospira santarosai]|uniref:LIC10362 family protein n=1 Tax=Leptospira santarosai TaxID=28183 RepID=UPI00031FBC9A|nr:hypothetical protein [Leptospira santarosai]MBW9232695.1 hypothetical protein [Leptospira santarosai]MDO6384107.1 hypothetical protein [Leptospira santarosai]OLY59852.1 hypothetical protein BV917_14405 [Leptospira santarosai serovar Guaricura]